MICAGSGLPSSPVLVQLTNCGSRPSVKTVLPEILPSCLTEVIAHCSAPTGLLIRIRLSSDVVCRPLGLSAAASSSATSSSAVSSSSDVVPATRGRKNEPGSVTSPGSPIQSLAPGHCAVVHFDEIEQAKRIMIAAGSWLPSSPVFMQIRNCGSRPSVKKMLPVTEPSSLLEIAHCSAPTGLLISTVLPSGVVWRPLGFEGGPPVFPAIQSMYRETRT